MIKKYAIVDPDTWDRQSKLAEAASECLEALKLRLATKPQEMLRASDTPDDGLLQLAGNDNDELLMRAAGVEREEQSVSQRGGDSFPT